VFEFIHLFGNEKQAAKSIWFEKQAAKSICTSFNRETLYNLLIFKSTGMVCLDYQLFCEIHQIHDLSFFKNA